MLKYLRLVAQRVPHILNCYFRWMLKYSRHPERYPFEERYAAVRELISSTIAAYRINLSVEGLEYLNEIPGPVVLVSNHQSMFDVLLLISLSKKPITFISKDEVRKYPFVGRCLRAIEGGFIDRTDVRQNLAIMNLATSRLQEGYCSYGIYPEGHRNPDHFGPLQEFHPGSFKMVYRSGVPLVAVATFGSFRAFPAKPDYKSTPIQLKFFPPYYPQDYQKMTTTEFAPLIAKQIGEEVEKMKAVDRDYFAEGKDKRFAPLPDWRQAYMEVSHEPKKES